MVRMEKCEREQGSPRNDRKRKESNNISMITIVCNEILGTQLRIVLIILMHVCCVVCTRTCVFPDKSFLFWFRTRTALKTNGVPEPS